MTMPDFMQDWDNETVALAVAGAGLLALWAFQRKSGGGSGLGQVGGYRIGLGTSTDPKGNNGPYTTLPPASWMYLNVCGLDPATDWVEWNYTPNTSPGSFDSSFPTPWQPQYATKPVGWYAQQQPIVAGCWADGVVAPQTPGSYTVIVAVNGQVVWTQQLTIAGVSGGYSGAIQVGAQGVPTSNPAAAASSGPAVTPITIPFYPASSSGQSTNTAQQGSTALALTNAMPSPPANAQSTSVAAGGIDLSSLLTGTVFGIPTWILLAGGVAAVWYFSTRKG